MQQLESQVRSLAIRTLFIRLVCCLHCPLPSYLPWNFKTKLIRFYYFSLHNSPDHSKLLLWHVTILILFHSSVFSLLPLITRETLFSNPMHWFFYESLPADKKKLTEVSVKTSVYIFLFGCFDRTSVFSMLKRIFDHWNWCIQAPKWPFIN